MFPINGSTVSLKLPLIGERLPLLRSAKSLLAANFADFIILLCSFAFITTSILYLSLVFYARVATSQHEVFFPSWTLSFLPRVISSLSLAIASAMIVVAGKRYLFFQLANGGLRTHRVAVYSSPTIINLAGYLISHGTELPLLCLLAVWVLALVTCLTVNDCWYNGTLTVQTPVRVPTGPLDASSNYSWANLAVGQLTYVISAWSFKTTGSMGLINVIDSGTETDSSHYPMGVIYFPPLPDPPPLLFDLSNYTYSGPAAFNGLNISIEQLTSVPSTAQELPLCTQDTFQLFYDWSDNQTLSLIADNKATFRINATAIIMGGTLSFNGSSTTFALNGTSWPNVMSTGNRWAEDLTSVICNPTLSMMFRGYSFLEFVNVLNIDVSDMAGSYQYWSSALNIAIGAYSSGMMVPMFIDPPYPILTSASVTRYGVGVRLGYGTYILCLNVIVSIVMLVIVGRLCVASPFGPDFLNPTRLLLDPLKKPELFNASLQTTVDVLANPYMRVGPDNEFILAEQRATREPARKGRGMLSIFNVRTRTRLDDFYEDSTMEMM